MMMLERDFTAASETFCDVKMYTRFWHEEGLQDLLMSDTNDICDLEDPISAPLPVSSWSLPYGRDGIIPFSRKIVLSNPAYVPEVHEVLPASEHTGMGQAHVQTFGRRRPHSMRQLPTRSTWECSECIKAHHTEDVDRIHMQKFGRPQCLPVWRYSTYISGEYAGQDNYCHGGTGHQPHESSGIVQDLSDHDECHMNHSPDMGCGSEQSWL
jgi:hypothetical protein